MFNAFNTQRIAIALRAAKAFQAFLVSQGIQPVRAAVLASSVFGILHSLPQYAVLAFFRGAPWKRLYLIALSLSLFDHYVVSDREAFMEAVLSLIPKNDCPPFATSDCEGKAAATEPCAEEPVFVDAQWLDAVMVGREAN